MVRRARWVQSMELQQAGVSSSRRYMCTWLLGMVRVCGFGGWKEVSDVVETSGNLGTASKTLLKD
jgi:hypothetical protein